MNNSKVDYSSSLIIGKQPSNDSYDAIHTVIASSANIRSKPSIKSQIIVQVKQGMKLIVIESNENWSKVHALEKTGWIASRLLKKIHAKQ